MWRDSESDDDFLNFTELSDQVVTLVNDADMLPISIGVFGGWGTGKSTVLRLVQNRLPPRKEKTGPIVVTFDAWLYQGFDDAKAALMQVVASTLLQVSHEEKSAFQKALKVAGRVNYFRALTTIADFGVGMAMGVPPGLLTGAGKALTAVVAGNPTGGDLAALKQAGKGAVTELKEWIAPEERHDPPAQIVAFRKEFAELLAEMNTTLIVIIDNLDRCLPEVAISTLEAVRLFLFMPRTAFVIAADEEMIRHSVQRHFSDPDSVHIRDYLDKVIQVPLKVPRVSEEDLRAYLYSLFVSQVAKGKLAAVQSILLKFLQSQYSGESWTKEQIAEAAGGPAGLLDRLAIADQLAPLLVAAPDIHGNPRIVKRLLNSVVVRERIAAKRKLKVDLATLTKLAVFERCTSEAATAKLFALITNEDSSPVLAPSEQKDDELPTEWKNFDSFIAAWRKLDPPFTDNKALRAAVFLSRDVLAPALKRGLSPEAAMLLPALLEAKSDTSPAVLKMVNAVQLADARELMARLIVAMRQSGLMGDIAGFYAALALAKKHPELLPALRDYFGTLDLKLVERAAAFRIRDLLKG